MSSHSTLTQRALIRLSPTAETEDVRGFLQGLVTQDMRLVVPGKPQYGALLSAQGKTLFDFLLWDDGADILIDCAREVAGDLAKRLTLYRLRRNISIAREEALCVHWSPEPTEGASPDPRLAALGWRWLAPAGADGDQGADDAWRAHRLALGVPEGIAELGDILWLETNAVELHGVSFDKGCYVGQENTARMNWRQKVNRRIVVLPIVVADPKRQKVVHEDLGLSVEHRRTEDLAALDLPGWQRAAIG
ncbi:CAF17-like 4Fe-4S cluster assembly/insertion protein YgfZ [Sphingomonas sp. 35-24ZXX]|uniref:CAF17-like 4Fe-4S cluster assembly/insertion protein YgfZ n=1 Tax=Sphingomonas sp. 35-24ZXX TaxID=1545915 RepID=UPI00053BF6FB|nr:folate-binding protein YgfZ [Sphingomonas sp. 35-24ZXX]